MAHENCDFSGWVTRNNIRCADGRIIKKDAFRVNDGQTVPLVWNHQHNSVQQVLGHTILENRDEGVYGYSYFNKTAAGQDAKETVRNGDVTNLSIWANNLQQIGPEVNHGVIREVSLVLAGANPGAFIESVMAHGEPMEDGDTEGIFYLNDGLVITHAIEKNDEPENDPEEKEDGNVAVKTVGDIYKAMNDDQKKAVAVIVGAAVSEAKKGGGSSDDEEEDDDGMRHTIFNKNNNQQDDGQMMSVLTKDDFKEMVKVAKASGGSMKEAFHSMFMEDDENGNAVLMHALPTTGMTGPATSTATQSYGFRDPNMLFPDYKTLQTQPEWISRNMDWVQKVLGGVHHTPFARVKSVYADITEDAARAKGYIKGNLKKEEVFTLLKRTTEPQTIYKKQKMDRDDIIDISDWDVVAWIRAEMRVMLNEEIARAILIGDGRASDSEDKIREDHIRPIAKDVDLYSVKVKVVTTGDAADDASNTIDEVIRSRKKYKGSGNPTFFTTEDVLTEMLLLKDSIGHRMYKTEAELATALRVKEIVTVEPMEGQKITVNNASKDLLGIIVNMGDYNVGADKGGQITMFDDFDIDYNQQKYLIETRISGALIKPFSALVVYADPKTTGSSGGTG